MKKMAKSAISVLLTLAMILQLFPSSVFAQEAGSLPPVEDLADDALLLDEEEVFASDDENQSAEILFEEESLREENVKQFCMSDGSYVFGIRDCYLNTEWDPFRGTRH